MLPMLSGWTALVASTCTSLWDQPVAWRPLLHRFVFFLLETVTCKQKLAKTAIFADCHQSDTIDLAWLGKIWPFEHLKLRSDGLRWFSLCLSEVFFAPTRRPISKSPSSRSWERQQNVQAHATWRPESSMYLFYFCLICLSSHDHGSGKWLYLKGNYYWRDPFWFSMIMGGSAVSVILLVSSNTDLADFFIGVIPFENRLTLRTFAGEIRWFSLATSSMVCFWFP